MDCPDSPVMPGSLFNLKGGGERSTARAVVNQEEQEILDRHAAIGMSRYGTVVQVGARVAVGEVLEEEQKVVDRDALIAVQVGDAGRGRALKHEVDAGGRARDVKALMHDVEEAAGPVPASAGIPAARVLDSARAHG